MGFLKLELDFQFVATTPSTASTSYIVKLPIHCYTLRAHPFPLRHLHPLLTSTTCVRRWDRHLPVKYPADFRLTPSQIRMTSAFSTLPHSSAHWKKLLPVGVLL